MIDEIQPTPLFAALERGDDAAVIRAIEDGCDVNARDNRLILGNGCSPLHVAAAHNNAVMISLLLESGADVNAVDADGRTPLWVACSDGDYQAVAALLAAGADAAIPDSLGRTPHGYLSDKIGRYAAIRVLVHSATGYLGARCG